MTKKLCVFMLLFSANVFATPVNINTADAQKIADSLKMIGEKKARSIIEYRVKNGQFKNVDDLKKVAGIGDKIIDKNKEDILFSDSLTSMAPVKK